MNLFRRLILQVGLTITASGCAHAPVPDVGLAAHPATLEIVDSSRGRVIPVALYGLDPRRPRLLAVLSPGYGSRNTDYSFLANELVRRGYVVAALQHDLEGDPPVPSGDNLAVRRRPFWAAGVANIRLAATELRRRGLAAPGRLILIGHSHGGDISMLHAAAHPDEVRAVFSLDNRRMALPRTGRPRICSARSSDYPADPGILPAPEEQARHLMVVEPMADQRHDDMWDGATAAQQAAMIAVLRRCLARL